MRQYMSARAANFRSDPRVGGDSFKKSSIRITDHSLAAGRLGISLEIKTAKIVEVDFDAGFAELLDGRTHKPGRH